MSKTDPLLRYVRKHFPYLPPAEAEDFYQALIQAHVTWFFARLSPQEKRDFLRYIGVPIDTFDWRDARLPAAYRFERLGEGR